MNGKMLMLALLLVAVGLTFAGIDIGTYYDDDYYDEDYYDSSTSCCCTGIILPLGLILGGYAYSRRI